MSGEAYDDFVELDEAYDDSDEDYGTEDTDDVLDSLMESSGSGYLAERKRGRGRRGRTPKRGVKTARGKPAYRTPPPSAGGAVSQTQLKEALGRVGDEDRRNAEGIKTINARLNTLGGQVDGVLAVTASQTRTLTRIDKQMKIDGAFEFVEAFTPTQAGASINVYQLLKGATKSGFLGDGTGAMSNPLVIGGLGLLLNNPNLLSGILAPKA